MARQNSQFGRFESLETRKMMTGDMGMEFGASTDSTAQPASAASQAEYARDTSENQATTSPPSSSEIKKHSSKVLKTGCKGDVIKNVHDMLLIAER